MKLCAWALVADLSWPTVKVSAASLALCTLLTVRLTPSMTLSKVLLALVSSMPPLPKLPPMRMRASCAVDSVVLVAPPVSPDR